MSSESGAESVILGAALKAGQMAQVLNWGIYNVGYYLGPVRTRQAPFKLNWRLDESL
jgi:hypothetical protein